MQVGEHRLLEKNLYFIIYDIMGLVRKLKIVKVFSLHNIDKEVIVY